MPATRYAFPFFINSSTNYLDEFRKEFVEQKQRHDQERASKTAELSRIQKKIDNIMSAIESGNIVSNTVNERLQEYEAQLAVIKDEMDTYNDIEMPETVDIDVYKEMLNNLKDNLYDKYINPALMNQIRPLIDKIILHPTDDGYQSEIHGDITKLPTLRVENSDNFFVSKDTISEW